MLDLILLLFLILFIPAVKGFIAGSFLGHLISSTLYKDDVFLEDKAAYSGLFHISSIVLAFLLSDLMFFGTHSYEYEYYYLFKAGMFAVVYAFSLLGIKLVAGEISPLSLDKWFFLVKAGLAKFFHRVISRA